MQDIFGDHAHPQPALNHITINFKTRAKKSIPLHIPFALVFMTTDKDSESTAEQEQITTGGRIAMQVSLEGINVLEGLKSLANAGGAERFNPSFLVRILLYFTTPHPSPYRK